MNKWMRLFALVCVFSVTAAACGSDEEASAFKQCKVGETDGDFNFYNWSEYMDPDLITAFEEQFGVTVTEDFYPSNEEMFGRVEVGASGYDMIIPSDYMVSILISEAMIQPVQAAAVPNKPNVSETFEDPPYDPGAVYTSAYQWGTTGIGVDIGVTGEVPHTWGLLFDAGLAEEFGLAGKITILDDPRETMGAALKYLGYSLNSTSESELAEAEQVIADAVSRVAAFDSDQYGDLMVTGETIVGHGYSGNFLWDFEEGDSEYDYFVPDEGGTIWVDNMAVLADAPHPCTAFAFMNFLLDAENGAQLTNFNWYASPNAASEQFIDQEVLDNTIIYPTDMSKLEFISDTGDFEINFTDALSRARS
ncbi:MAG: spermidine/putrescine ABC transporter substrate-binding protein [Actinobacteria bacterium]|nr:spermidine/putrescine ABC transporter substrate-binding protein [Actinomycetota bacterium]